jgi:hypothetical protein
MKEVVCKFVKNGKVLVRFSSATVGPGQRTMANLSGIVVAGILMLARLRRSRSIKTIAEMKKLKLRLIVFRIPDLSHPVNVFNRSILPELID